MQISIQDIDGSEYEFTANTVKVGELILSILMQLRNVTLQQSKL